MKSRSRTIRQKRWFRQRQRQGCRQRQEQGQRRKEKKAEEPKDAALTSTALEQRVARVPLDADNYFGLTVTADALIYAVAPEVFMAGPRTLRLRCGSSPSKTGRRPSLVDDIGGFVVSHDGSKVLVRQEQAWNVYDATAAAEAPKRASPLPA